MLLHYSVNAGEALMTHCLHGKHLELSGDSGYGGSSAASTDSEYRGSSLASTDMGYDGSSTMTTSTHSLSHLVENNQKMSMHPHEGKFRYARTDYQGLSQDNS